MSEKKRHILVVIEAEAKHCGKCRFLGWDGRDSRCSALGDDGGSWARLSVKAGRALRSKACLWSEDFAGLPEEEP